MTERHVSHFDKIEFLTRLKLQCAQRHRMGGLQTG